MTRIPSGQRVQPSRYRAGLRGVPVAVALCCLIVGTAATARAQVVMYNTIQSPLPGNVLSDGLEANSIAELGDLLVFAPGTPRQPGLVKVVLDSFACTSGHWFNDTCVTSPAGATFSQAVTLNIYAVDGGVSPALLPGALLFSQTQTFNIPYRPSDDVVNCGGDGWFSTADSMCYHGIAYVAIFDLTFTNLTLPDQVIMTVSFNTTHAGPSPIGTSAPCFSGPGGCPYDSLNVSTDTTQFLYPVNFVGTNIDPNGIYVNYILSPPNASCSGTAAPGLMDDTPCWFQLHPEIEVDSGAGFQSLSFFFFFGADGGGGNCRGSAGQVVPCPL